MRRLGAAAGLSNKISKLGLEIGCFVSTEGGASYSNKNAEGHHLQTRHFFHLDDALRLYLLHTLPDGTTDYWEPYTMDESSELSQVSKVWRSHSKELTQHESFRAYRHHTLSGFGASWSIPTASTASVCTKFSLTAK